MNATVQSNITAKPSIREPMANSKPSLDHQTHVRTTGSTNGSAPCSSAAWVGAMARAIPRTKPAGSAP